MADWNQVRKLALALPETGERPMYGWAAWCVRDKCFAWERPLGKSDLEALGKAAPTGPILAVRVENLIAKEAKLEAMPGICFTTPHFNGYPAILIRLPKIAAKRLEDLIVEAWLARAPKKLAKEFLSVTPHRRSAASARTRRRAT